MAGLQNYTKLITIPWPGNPIWRLESWMYDWNFERILVSSLNIMKIWESMVFPCGFRWQLLLDVRFNITQDSWQFSVTRNSRWRPGNRKCCGLGFAAVTHKVTWLMPKYIRPYLALGKRRHLSQCPIVLGTFDNIVLPNRIESIYGSGTVFGLLIVLHPPSWILWRPLACLLSLYV